MERLSPRQNKKVIYTAVFGGYDKVREPKYRPEGFDFVCFSDRKFRSDTWQVRVVEPTEQDDPRNNRKYKVLPHRYLGSYDISIYIDANMLVKGDAGELADKYLKDANLAVFDHSFARHNDIHSSPNVIKSVGEGLDHLLEMSKKGRFKDDPALMVSQYESYKKEGFPDNSGQAFCIALVRRHNEEDVKKTMELWWRQIQVWSRRDQLSFNYAAWKTGLKFNYIKEDARNNSFFSYMPHKRPLATLGLRLARWCGFIPVLREFCLFYLLGKKITLGHFLYYLFSPYVFVSFPKSGRSWVRFFIDSYYKETGKRPPAIIYKHFILISGSSMEESANLIPKIFSLLRRKKALLMFRDPRDVLVSYYFQLLKRDGEIRNDMSIAEFAKIEKYGIKGIIKHMNACLSNKGRFKSVQMLRYRDLRNNPEELFRNTLAFLGESNIDERAFTAALQDSDFQSMRDREVKQKEGKFKDGERPVRYGNVGSADDADSYKVRKGKVGGYKEYLTGEALQYVNNAIREELDPKFRFNKDNETDQ